MFNRKCNSCKGTGRFRIDDIVNVDCEKCNGSGLFCTSTGDVEILTKEETKRLLLKGSFALQHGRLY